ncbi:MAG: hypothetical protein GTN74_05545 [Proteobacteria bacterium]|nr:hypothetical protein [Pseudomonadota bacterium]NIS68961.1 hypothetical protein [Pseudomonadota bacterium]
MSAQLGTQFLYFPFDLLPHMAVQVKLEATEWANQKGPFLQLVYGTVGTFSTDRAGKRQFLGIFLRVHESLCLIFQNYPNSDLLSTCCPCSVWTVCFNDVELLESFLLEELSRRVMVEFEADRRTVKDRRRGPTKTAGRYLLFGRRQWIRRKSDRKIHFRVDRYGSRLLLTLLTIILLSVLDVYFTIFHLGRGAQEINPLMNFLAGYGDIYFFTAKYVLTASGILLLCIYKNLLFVRVIIVSIVVIYLIVLGNHILLLFLT